MASVVKQANCTLPEDLLDELKRTVPKGEQSKVVGQALRNELKRIKFKKALDVSFGGWKEGKHPELAQGARRFIRTIRKSTRLKGVASR